MRKGLFIIFAALIFMISIANIVSAISIGVKKGDWIEYKVTITGNPPPEHDAVWGKIEVKNIKNDNIYVDFTTRFKNGTILLEENHILNLATGVLGDDFIIPARLNENEAFLDKTQGYIRITGVQDRVVAGVKRTLVYGNTAETWYAWDRSTGILVEATSIFPQFTMTTITDKTNMWEPQVLGTSYFVILVFAATVSAAVIAAYVIFRRRAAMLASS